MNKIFHGPIAGELHGFLEFKRGLGFGYGRAEFALREFDRFLSGYVKKDPGWRLDQGAIAWLSSKPNRKPRQRFHGCGDSSTTLRISPAASSSARCGAAVAATSN